MQNLTGQSIGRYHIHEMLGEGGMANVYKAYDSLLDRNVAVKVIRVDAFQSTALERVMKRFEREAKSQARLAHPNIVKVYDFGTFGGSPYLVMEYISGGTLRERIGQPLEWQKSIKLIIPIALALGYAHQLGILHRDVKPANILMTDDGQPMLSDFGIAKLLDDQGGHTLTGVGMGVGTPEYMAPEQGLGKEVDGRADIYSLGVVLYELITGRTPFQADTPLAVLLKKVNDPLPRPMQYVRGLPDVVEKVLLKALAKKPKDRFVDMRSFANALERLAEEKAAPELVKPLKSEVMSVIPSSIDLKTSEEIFIESNSIQTESSKKDKESTSCLTKQGRNQKVLGWLIGVGCLMGLAFLIFTLSENQTSKPVASLTINPTNINYTNGTTITEPLTTAALLNTKSGTGKTKTREKDGMVMVYVPAGPFIMGSDIGENDEKPAHTFTLGGYWIDSTEVTNKMYAMCVQKGACFAPISYTSIKHGSYYANSKYDDYPVTYVNWNLAKAYCEWTGGRLPSEAEWEKAARGTDGRTYPWGENKPDRSLLNYNKNEGGTSIVGQYESGKSLYGAYDMAGNVQEWVADWFDAYPEGNIGASGDFGTKYHVLRGGSWILNDIEARSVNRRGSYPAGADSSIGFRCASSEESTINNPLSTQIPPVSTTLTSSPDLMVNLNGAGNNNNGGLAAIQGDWIFYSNQNDGGKIYRMQKDGSVQEKVNDDASGSINLLGDWIYYSNRSDSGKIYRMSLDGINKEKLSDDPISSITLTGDWIYYLSGFIYRMHLDGSGRETLSAEPCLFLNVVGDWIYFVDANDFYKIYRMRVDGREKQKLNDQASYDIVVVDDWIYYENWSNGWNIYRIHLDGSMQEKLVGENCRSLNIAGNWIFYTAGDYKSSVFYRMRFDGTGREILSKSPVIDINIVGNWIFYQRNVTNGKMYRMHIDGTEEEQVS